MKILLQNTNKPLIERVYISNSGISRAFHSSIYWAKSKLSRTLIYQAPMVDNDVQDGQEILAGDGGVEIVEMIN